MFADDLGFNDVGFTSSVDGASPTTKTQTPFLDNLAKNDAIIIKSHYVTRMCSPTRASFITGRYSYRIGLESQLLNPNLAVSLTRQVSTLSEEFKTAGYSTHAIGKWHLGYQSWEYTPTYRGFDSFYGYYNGLVDYYTSEYEVVLPNGNTYNRRDLRKNEKTSDAENTYGMSRFTTHALELIESKAESDTSESDSSDSDDDTPFFLYLAWQSSHEPSEAPESYYNLYKDDNSIDCNKTFAEKRHYTQAQTTYLDDSVKALVHSLKENNLWDNTIVVFASDNGAPLVCYFIFFFCFISLRLVLFCYVI